MRKISDFAIGSKNWNGLSKLIEESGEVVQVCGKLLGTGGNPEHWDGTHLTDRLEDELGDLLAAIDFVAERNSLSMEDIQQRRNLKFQRFLAWDTENNNGN